MQRIQAAELEQRMARDDAPTVIDVLPEDSFRNQHLPGSVNAPVSRDDFLRRVETLVNGKDDPVVVYCANEECDASPKAAALLEEAGYTDVADFEGGLKEWEDSGRPLEGDAAAPREPQETRR